MFKLLLLLLGIVGGAAAATAWLLSEPGQVATSHPVTGNGLQVRLVDVQARLREALAEGQQAGAETEQRLRSELEAYRKNPRRPAAS